MRRRVGGSGPRPGRARPPSRSIRIHGASMRDSGVMNYPLLLAGREEGAEAPSRLHRGLCLIDRRFGVLGLHRVEAVPAAAWAATALRDLDALLAQLRPRRAADLSRAGDLVDHRAEHRSTSGGRTELAPQKTSFSKLLASSAPWALSAAVGLGRCSSR